MKRNLLFYALFMLISHPSTAQEVPKQNVCEQIKPYVFGRFCMRDRSFDIPATQIEEGLNNTIIFTGEVWPEPEEDYNTESFSLSLVPKDDLCTVVYEENGEIISESQIIAANDEFMVWRLRSPFDGKTAHLRYDRILPDRFCE